MDRGVWQTVVHGVAKGQTQLSDRARLCSAHIWREGIVGSTAQLPCCASPSPLSEREEYLKTTRESG